MSYHCLFSISSFGSSESICFAIAAFSGHLHLCCCHNSYAQLQSIIFMWSDILLQVYSLVQVLFVVEN